MKKTVWLVVMALWLTVGCSSSNREAAMDYFLSDSSDTYVIHLFYEERTPLDMELLDYMNSSDELLTVIKGIQVYDVTRVDNEKRAKKIKVRKFPTMLVTNDKGIVVDTQDIEEVKAFFDQIVRAK
ncbi:hypothetical protein GNP94_18455 [Paenibacillus campinasensis]|uniref:Thioredoxin domain-containing protein n=1 Tax=Paenibacillus campinasensis TaxID=66347 RepID=A0ABW9T515_9BACL|nr:hypothetical protein [Paenibacillus campinasensis]MUG67972.1 hypothetical protein [Paenibacillus campinasensis]